METEYSRTIHVEHGYDKNAYTYYPIIIVGAGETGIAMGCQLKERLGFDQFRIFDRQSGVGGTWWINRYPGVACDVPCALYSYSFAPYYDSDKIYPSGQKIVQYLHGVASKYQIVDKIQLNTDISELRWVEQEQIWEATVTTMAPGTGDMGEKDRQAYIAKHGRQSVYLKQEKIKAKIAISAIGGLVEPKSFPDHIPGSENFKGELFHAARWKDDAVLKDKDIVVVGTGCSSAQIVQSLLDEHNVKSVTQLMRTPPWLQPKVPEPDRGVAYPTSVFDAVTKYPALGVLFRYLISIEAERTWFNIFLEREANTKPRDDYENQLLTRMRKLAPEKYQTMLTPNYPVGCKRRIFDPSPGWYDAMHDARYKLTTQKFLSVQEDGINVSGAQSYPPPSTEAEKQSAASAAEEFIAADVLVLANGYDIRDWLHPLRVFGRGGVSIHDVWKERGGPQAYMCCALDGFPNLFILNGPNVYTGHHSVFLASENMVLYTTKMISGILSGNVASVEVRKSASLTWAARTQREIKDTVFASKACNSWYKDESNGGWNSTVYPRSQTDFMWRCYFPEWADWKVVKTRRGEFREKMKKLLKMGAYAAVLVSIFAARRQGGLTGLVAMLKGWSKERINWVLQILTIVLMKVQQRLE